MLCAYEFLKMMNPLEQYSYLLALYTESAVAYNYFYTAYWYHTMMQYGSMPELLCGCKLLDMADANMAPGLNHQTTCAWYMTEAEQALAERTSNDPEFAEWAETASEEMIQRALSVKTLDHAVFEANENGVGYTLYIARYEEPVGSVDANGYLTYGSPALVIAWVDFTTGMVYFVNDLPENAPPVPAN